MTDHLIETRVEVTDRDGRHFVSRDPLDVLRCRYAEQDGYRLREVRGYEVSSGFCIVDRTSR